MRVPILVALLLAPFAAAGSEVAPEVDDSPDQEDPRLDLLAAWFENEPGGVRFTVKVATIEENATDLFYFVGFDMGGASRLAAVESDDEGNAIAYLGPQGPGSNGEPPEAIANGALERPAIRSGSPGYATAIIPFGPGARLENLSAGVSQYQRTRAVWADVDFRSTENSFTVERAIVPSAISGNALTIVLLVVLLALGVGAGTWFGLRSARRGEDGAEAAPEKTEKKSRFGLGKR